CSRSSMLQWLRGCLLLAVSAAALIPREKLFSDPKLAATSLSPDGKILGYIAPDGNKIKNVFTRCISCRHTRQVTFEKRDVLSYEWTGVEDIILFAQDNNGDENTMIFKKNISENAPTHERTIISNTPGIRATVVANNKKKRYVLIGLNDMTPAYHNVYKFDLYTNELSLILTNKRFPVVITDNDMRIRMAIEEQEDGTTAYFRVSSKANPKELTSDKDQWVEYIRVQPDDKPITAPIGFDKTNEKIYWIWGDGSDLGNLIVAPTNNISDREVLYTATRAQIGQVLFHPEDKTLLAVSEFYHKPELFVANDTVMEDLQYLVNLRPSGSLQILTVSKDMQTWLVTYLSAENPFEVFVYRRWLKSAELLFNTHPELEGYELNRQIGFDFAARDDLVIQAYLSLPPDAPLKRAAEVPVADKGYAELGMIPAKPQKMVLLVHGGPKSRDTYGFSPMNAWLTSRGYAVMQVNFRGSVGFGKRLTNAGNGEWGRKMHYDLLDAVEFAVAKGIANRSQVAIMGGSYGGYATLVGLTFTPDTFACGVDIVGPSNLVSLLEAVPPYWLGFYNDLTKMLGSDIDTQEGRQSLIARSPLFFADRVKKPLMILHGANDPRVKQHESEQFVAALKKHSIPVSYVLYPDEGHGFRRAPNRLAQCGFVERFLHHCLGGDYQIFTNGQYNESAILKSDGFAPKTTLAPTTTTTTQLPRAAVMPTLVPSHVNNFYYPQQPQLVQQFRPTVQQVQQAQQQQFQFNRMNTQAYPAYAQPRQVVMQQMQSVPQHQQPYFRPPVATNIFPYNG
ncbi:dpf-6, partial [Pristionchus pacificus]